MELDEENKQNPPEDANYAEPPPAIAEPSLAIAEDTVDDEMLAAAL